MILENYPGVNVRVKAIVTDSLVIVVLMFIAAYVFSLFESVSGYVRIISFVFIFLIYDPFFTSAFGGTIGHMMLGIRVKRESNEQENIPFRSAVLRYIVKVILGVISLLTVSGNEKRKAIHDYLVGSVVVFVQSKKNK